MSCNNKDKTKTKILTFRAVTPNSFKRAANKIIN